MLLNSIKTQLLMSVLEYIKKNGSATTHGISVQTMVYYMYHRDCYCMLVTINSK